MSTALLILHGLVAVALLGAITHQTLAVWAPTSASPRSFFGRFRAVQPAGYANAIVGLYLGTTLLGAIVYLYFKVDIQPDLPLLAQSGHPDALTQCPLLGVKRTSSRYASMSAKLEADVSRSRCVV